MNLTVACYSGHTFAGRPRAFIWRGRRYVVEQVLKRWRSPEGPGFRVLTTEGEQFELTYKENRDEWSLQETVHAIHPKGESHA